MKKLLFLLATVGIIFTACQSGGDIEEDNGGAPFVPEITISPNDLTFGCNVGEQEVVITANFEYEVAERASWLTVEQTDEGLLVVVDANKNTSERSAFISITNSQYDINKSIEVYQEAWVPKIELAQQSVEVEFEPAEYEVGVTSPYSWEATTKNDWIIVDTPNGIAGAKMLKFSVARNEEEDIREGTIVVKNEDYNLVAELYITQKAFVPAITIEPESLAFAVEGGTQEIAITANFEYTYSANADWLTIEKSEKGLKVTASNHTEVENRTAEITLSNEKYGVSKVINVTQNAFVPDEIIIDPESLTFTFEGGTQDVAITANFEYEFLTEADWLT
ncbi:MAG: BACON domain-containing protein, partial [Alistipes sp.]|nr:BACON domain-containing protein [Alistipes sp.]